MEANSNNLLLIGAALGSVLALVMLLFFSRRKSSGPTQSDPIKRDVDTSAPKIAPQSLVSDAQRTQKGLSKTKAFFQDTFDRFFAQSNGQNFFEDLEELFLTADISLDYSHKITNNLKNSFGITLPERTQLKQALSLALANELPADKPLPVESNSTSIPQVILIVGVNGAGKTTTIAKLASRFLAEKKSLLLGAADTYRAAAINQLQSWASKVNVEVVAQQDGSDPSAVAFDAVQAAISRKKEVCIIDTAGRLHTKNNLMEELKKMKRVIAKALPSAPHQTWLVLDGSTGQNAFHQAQEFHEALSLTGLIVTKLDGTAKGGSILATSSLLQIPIIYIGVGEQPEDLIPFDKKNFVETILEGL